MPAVRILFVVALAMLASRPAGAGFVEAERPAEARAYSAAPVAQDTLRYSVQAGRPLIVALPARFEGGPASYELVEAPALSWLVDRSFLWSTQPGERGALPIKIRRTAPGAFPDTLVLIVDIAGT